MKGSALLLSAVTNWALSPISTAMPWCISSGSKGSRILEENGVDFEPDPIADEPDKQEPEREPRCINYSRFAPPGTYAKPERLTFPIVREISNLTKVKGIKRGFYFPDKAEEAKALFMLGRSTRQVCEALKMGKATAIKVRKIVQLPLCGCGQQSGHRGWCRVRFAASPRRQQFIQQWRVMRSALHQPESEGLVLQSA